MLWSYGNGGAGNDTRGGSLGNFATYITAVANEVVYLVTTEHTVQTPIYKGSMARAVNATDGTEIWTLNAYTGEFTTGSYAIADGFATFFNGYDNTIYSVGKGPSALTVEAPKVGIELGRSLVISGTVMDISAGSQKDEQMVRFPNGVPAVSDASMSDWMGYVYQQKPRPTDTTGVEVTLSVLDSNNNYREIGKTTSNSDGFFTFNWTPDIEGQYTVTATFGGTAAYWPSHAFTAFAVDPAAPTLAPTQEPVTSMADTYLLPGIAAIIVVIAIGFAVTIIVLRKRQ